MTDEQHSHIRPDERPIISAIVDDALKAGLTASVRYEGPAYHPDDSAIERSTDRDAILAEVAATDETWLVLFKPGEKRQTGWVRLVHGNDFHVICDHADNPEMQQLVARAERIAEEIEDRHF
jgi:hypothetical protein